MQRRASAAGPADASGTLAVNQIVADAEAVILSQERQRYWFPISDYISDFCYSAARICF